MIQLHIGERSRQCSHIFFPQQNKLQTRYEIDGVAGMNLLPQVIYWIKRNGVKDNIHKSTCTVELRNLN